MDEQILEMLMLIHCELQYNSSLMAGLFPKPYVDENIVPKLNEFNAKCENILMANESIKDNASYFTS